MKRNRMIPANWLLAIIQVLGLSLASPFSLAQQAPPVDEEALVNAGETGAQWPSYGLDPGETRYSRLDRIDADNVSRLRLAWSYDVGPGGGVQEATPLVWNGRLYGITNWSIVFAVDARTGRELWRWDPEVNQATVRSKLCCGVVQRGLALYRDMVIAPALDGRLIALDARTGRPVWETRVAWSQDKHTLTMAPRIAGGNVIIGAAGGEFPTRGFFAAFDAMTGAHQWTFYTVPGDPSLPFENEAMRMAAATWDGEWWKFGGGGPVWDGLAYDPETNLVFAGTGNGGPWPEALRQSEGMDNLFVSSILAVDAGSGELAWYYQTTPGDSWDYDSTQGFVLTDLTIGGRKRKVLMQANKNGFLLRARSGNG
jgi:quinohemoprotein ethanol dehydrogenase